MIDLLAKTINEFTSLIGGAFLIASLIGQLIVSISTAVISSVFNICKSIVYFFQIIYEDNIFILTEEIPSFTNNIIVGISDLWTFLHNCLSAICDYTIYKTSNIVATLLWIVNAVSTVVIEVLFLLKRSLIFIGDTLWFILSFIPVHLPLLVRATTTYIKDIAINTIVDGYLILLKLTNFLTDVPLESFVGITSAIIIIRLCVHFREYVQSQITLLYWMLVRKFRFLYHTIYHYFTDSEVRAIARMAGGQEVERHVVAENVINDDDHGDPGDALCVVCQERQKCVLILPCRHVCLCRDCCLRLYGYQRTCPICRTFIYHSVNIYL